MKKVVVLITMALLGLSSTYAQKIDFGIKGGLNFAKLGGDVDTDSRTGFHAGFIAEVNVLGLLSVQPELLYSTVGSETAGNENLKLDYLSVPILAKYYVIPSVLSIDAGPQFSYLINDNLEDIGLAPVEGFDQDTKSMDVAGAIGLGVKTPLGVFAQARYLFGITSALEGIDANNNVFQLSVGYKF